MKPYCSQQEKKYCSHQPLTKSNQGITDWSEIVNPQIEWEINTQKSLSVKPQMYLRYIWFRILIDPSPLQLVALFWNFPINPDQINFMTDDSDHIAADHNEQDP